MTQNNISEFKLYLLNYNWSSLYRIDNAHHAFDLFISTLENSKQKFLSKKKIYTKNSYLNKPWLIEGLKKCIIKKNKLYQNLKKKHSVSNETIYKKYKNCLSKIVNKAERYYYSQYFITNRNNPKQIWNKINTIIHNNKNGNIVPNVIEDNKRCEQFNDYFCNIGEKLASKSEKNCNTNNTSNYIHNNHTNSLFITPTNPIEITNIVEKSKPTNSTDSHNFSFKLIIQIISSISNILSYLINLCIQQGIFPNCLKTAKVVTKYKSGNIDDPSNFRPISLLSSFSKISEKVLKSRYIDFMEKNKIINKSQFGFKKGVSTSDALTDLTGTIASNKMKYCAAISIDLKKAFDSISHDLLINKLEKYGFRGVALKLLISFLNNRNQFVIFNKSKSKIKNIKFGVPQGSVLGPLLFLIFINDIVNIKTQGHFVLFADDTTIIFRENNIDSMENSMNKTLKNLDIWLSLNKLTINLSKTNYLIFNNNKAKLSIILNNIVIIQKNSIKLLGVIIDSNMNWKLHTNMVKSKLYYGLSILRKLNNIVPINILKLIYYSVFHCHLIYCTHIWGNNYDVTSKQISIAQNKAIRILYRQKNRTNVDNIYKEQHILTFKEIIFYNACKIMFRIKNYQMSTTIINLFKLQDTTYNMRDNNKFKIPLVNTNAKKFNITYYGPICWNNLPIQIKSYNSQTTLNQFCSKIKYLISCNL